MAWIFSLSAECGVRQEAAKAFVAHFDGFVARLEDGSTYPCHTDCFQDREMNWWGGVWPEGISKVGIRDEDDVIQMNGIARVLYDVLRNAPTFRYARVGVEVDEFRYFSELGDDLVKSDHFNGVVLADEVWRGLGSPETYVEFGPGYRWRPFTGVS